MLMTSPALKRFRISRINTEVNEKRPGCGTLESEPHAAKTSILPFFESPRGRIAA